MLYCFSPYAPPEHNMNLGWAYNEYMKMIPSDDDWVLFTDHDFMLVTKDWYEQICEIIEIYKHECQLFCAMTNNVGMKSQTYPEMQNEHDFRKHAQFGKTLAEDKRHDIAELNNLMSGYCFVISKKLWNKYKFVDGFYRVDNQIYRDAKKEGKVYLMTGVYGYHAYGLTPRPDPKIAVYTVICNEYDSLRQDILKEEGIDYWAILDEQTAYAEIERNNFWRITINEDERHPDMHMNQRGLKIIPPAFLMNYDYIVYIDGNIRYSKPLIPFLEKFCYGSFITLPNHNESNDGNRNCIYEEIDACIRLNKDTKKALLKQRTKAKRMKIPKNWGLWETHTLIRWNQPDTWRFCQQWWNELLKGSRRDQVALPLTVHHTGFTVNSLHSRRWWEKELGLQRIMPHNKKIY